MNANNLFWFSAEKEKVLLREQLFQVMDTAFYLGLIDKKYHMAELKAATAKGVTDSLSLLAADSFDSFIVINLPAARLQ